MERLIEEPNDFQNIVNSSNLWYTNCSYTTGIVAIPKAPKNVQATTYIEQEGFTRNPLRTSNHIAEENRKGMLVVVLLAAKPKSYFKQEESRNLHTLEPTGWN